MADPGNRQLQVDIISDVVCPWCIIGYKQLERALEEAGISAEITWHPFELNPTMAEEGENLRAHLAAKYGTTLQGSIEARARLTAIGAELGFIFDYADDMMTYNTFRAHRLLHWAELRDRQHELEMALFSAFFTYRRNINDVRVLADEAGAIGLDRDEALAVLDEGRYAHEVREKEHTWTSKGIHGVPAMVFNDRYLVSGAQGVESYVSILRQLVEGRAA